MNAPPYQEIPPRVIESQRDSDRKSNRHVLLRALAFALFGLAIIGVWQMFSNLASIAEVPSTAFMASLTVTVLSLLLFAVVLVEESRIAERSRLDTNYQTRIAQLEQRIDYHQNLLSLVANHQTASITIFDRHNRYFFVNSHAAHQLGLSIEEIVGQDPQKILSPDAYKRLEVQLAWARTQDEPRMSVERTVDDAGNTRFVQRYYAVLAEMDGSVILREEDFTPLIVERERREQMLRQVIDTLVAVVDRRDPYATGHSKRVGQLSKAIAEEMGLEKTEVEAAEIAGSLMNFGKVLVSRRILTKTSALTPEELQRVRDSILVSADIVEIIGFDGPVVPTLRQVLERYDGSGVPEGLKGDAILVTAQIVSAANAFVAFVSPRAHREGLSYKEALSVMANDANKAFGERILIAMSNYIEKRPNKIDWLKPKQ